MAQASSTPSSFRRRSVRGLRLPPSPVPADDPDSACLLYATHPPLTGPRDPLPQCRLSPTVTVHPCLRSVTHSPCRRYATHSLPSGPRGRVPQCRLRPTVTVHPCLRSVTHSLFARPRGQAPTVSANLPQCVTALRGPGVHSIRVNCDGCAYLQPTFPQYVTGLRSRLPTVSAPGNCVDLRWPPLRVALLPRRAAGPGSHRIGQG